MLAVFARRIAVVLARTIAVAGAALGIDIDRATIPVRRGAAAMTADTRAGAIAVAGCGAALGVPGCCDTTINQIVVCSAGVTGGAIVSYAIQGCMHTVRAGCVRESTAGRGLAVATIAGSGVGITGFEGVQPVDQVGLLGRRDRAAVTSFQFGGNKNALPCQVDITVCVITGDQVAP